MAPPEVGRATSLEDDPEFGLAVGKERLQFLSAWLTSNHPGCLGILVSNLKNIFGKISTCVQKTCNWWSNMNDKILRYIPARPTHC